jgi:cell division protein FtsN
MAQMVKTQRSGQRGGFVLGMIVGLLIGLALALAVALYITKVPVPFVDKVPQRTAEQDAAEAEKNRNWDPNAPLAGKGAAARPVPGLAPAIPAASAAVPPAVTPPPVVAPAPAVVPPTAAPAAASRAEPSAGALDKSAKAAAQAFQYYVQVGAYTRTEEAEQQRARLAINGMVARITEREQAGHTMYRVRLGPFDVREDADRAKEQAAGVGFSDAALVRVAR